MTDRKISAIVFDKDGTLFDFRATWEAWAQAFLLRATGGDRARASLVGQKIGFDLENHRFSPDSIVIADTPMEIANALLPYFENLSLTELIDMLNEEAARAPQAEAVPLRPLLSHLRALGLMLGVATNDSESPALTHLQNAGVLDMFDFVAGCDSGHGAKPGPGQLLAFAQATGIAPGQIVMVGDSIHDLHAGKRARMVTIGVLTGLATEADLAPYADVILPDIGHIPAWLGQSGINGG